ncbi:MAG: hypothetical protein Pg6C_08210 [Treponemataceae bacterium]|nr:MAG: hypothetical protein Pg6C_08210 [Treponemataceae bacterium]
METAQTIGSGMTFEETLAMARENTVGIRELRESIRELRENHEREAKERRESFERETKERRENFEREMKERRESLERETKERRERLEREMKEARESLERETRESRESLERETRESRENLERETKESIERQERIDRKIEKLSDNLGGLGRSIGDLIEILVAARLWEKFPEYGMQQAFRRLPIYDEHYVAKTDIDILLMNTEWAMAVEVKREADRKDVEHHIERMARILKYPPAQLRIVPGIKLLGALAGGVVEADAREYAHESGFYVLELTGETVSRAPEPPGFKPKMWGRE